ncbi:MAG: hypothetical protein ACNYPG_00750 [Candidatus Porifericomitaceae bacterium WSBS_2022_MAG_OTU9]
MQHYNRQQDVAFMPYPKDIPDVGGKGDSPEEYALCSQPRCNRENGLISNILAA